MLHLEKTRSDKTVKIKILNRLFYLAALDGLSREEAARLWHELIDHMQTVLEANGTPAPMGSKWYVHYLWWEHQKVSVIFMTGDVVDQLEDATGTQDLLNAISEFEDEQIKIPYCSANALDGTLTGRNSAMSRISISTNDDDGEIAVYTTEEICHAAFRR